MSFSMKTSFVFDLIGQTQAGSVVDMRLVYTVQS